MSKQITVGVIGAGRIGKLHIENMKHMSNVRLKTVSDMMVDGLQEWFLSSGAESLTADYQDILKDPEIDAVFICSPTDTHATIIKEAARAGKHIFCEKPISFSDQETIDAYQVVKETGVKFQLGFNRRFDRNFRKVKELVGTKQIGDLHILKITSRDPEPPPLEYVVRSGGIFADMSIHDFDMARYITGSEVTEVYVRGAALVNPALEQVGDIDTAIILLTFANGTMGVIDNSRQAVYGYDQRLEAFGSNGSASAENETGSTVSILTKDGGIGEKPLHFFLERYNEAYKQEVGDFFSAIDSNTECTCKFEDGIMAQRIAMAAKESLETGLPVAVKQLQELPGEKIK